MLWILLVFGLHNNSTFAGCPRDVTEKSLAPLSKEFSTGGKTQYQSAYHVVKHMPIWQGALAQHLDAIRPEALVIVDAGGGMGLMTAEIQRLHPKARVDLLDLNPDMATKAPEVSGVHPDRVHISDITAMRFGGRKVGDGTSIPANSVDHVLTHSVLWMLDSPDAFFKEAGRVLKPGGRLVVSTISPQLQTPSAREAFLNILQEQSDEAVAASKITAPNQKTVIDSNRTVLEALEKKSPLPTKEHLTAMARGAALIPIQSGTTYQGHFLFLIFEKQ